LCVRARARAPEPVGVGVYRELDGEDGGEEGVEGLELLPDGCDRAVCVKHFVDDLRLRRVDGEILPPPPPPPPPP
jgi:hypothetical protein